MRSSPRIAAWRSAIVPAPAAGPTEPLVTEGAIDPLLSKLRCERMSPLEYGEVETDQGSTPPRDRRLTRERILQHVQPAAQAVSADGVPGARHADVRRAPRARVHVLGAVRRHAVLPARPRPFAAGDLRGSAQQRGQAQAPRHHRAEPLDAGLCQRPSPVAALPGRVRGACCSAASRWPRAGGSSGSSTSSSVWTRRSSTCARPCSTGRSSDARRARSSSIACWITTGISPAWSSSPRGNGMTCGWPARCASTRGPSS